ALELSYTDAVSLQNQRASSADVPRTVYQKTQIIGGDLIYVFADRKALLQPFVKAGIASISRRQEIKDGSFNTSPLDPDNAVAPSYGLGVKIALTENFGLKASYSIWQTPIGGGSKTNDDAVTAGVTWMF
ncbi:MAG: outer membrane beta-barrel protein, partial [Bdellovibrionaceae bacterium]|nr:outer membrane beta-barrel protein [Pseudobdellovibrionaceae bacterium]